MLVGLVRLSVRGPVFRMPPLMMRVSMVALDFGSLAPTTVVVTWMVRATPPRSRKPSVVGVNSLPLPVIRTSRPSAPELVELLLSERLPVSTRMPVAPVFTPL